MTSGPRIGGGVAAKTHRLTLHERDGSEQNLILKRYPVGNDTPQLEWDRLGCAARVPLPTPDRVAVDPNGSWFGEPALVMTMLPGRVDMVPSDIDDWTRQLALALATIHQTELGSDIPPVLRRPHLVSTWRLWDIDIDTRVASATAAIERLQNELPKEPGPAKAPKCRLGSRRGSPAPPKSLLFVDFRFRRSVLILAMTSLPPIVRAAVQEYRQALEAALPGRVRRLTVFGSVARGQANEDSDVDILLLLEDPSFSERAGAIDRGTEVALRHSLIFAPVVLSVGEWAELENRERSLPGEIARDGIDA